MHVRSLSLALVAVLAVPGLSAAPYDLAIPSMALDEGGSTARPAGFREAVLSEPTIARVESTRTGAFDLTLLAGGWRVEMIHPEQDGDEEVRVLLADGRTAWVTPRALDPAEDPATLTPTELTSTARERAFEPFKNLPAGLSYRFLYRHGARLHLVVADLRANPRLELLPHVTAKYNREVAGGERVAAVKALAYRSGAFVAMNGPFFIPGGRERGKPLGVLIGGGKVLYDLQDPYVLAMHRTYLAYTSAGRFVMGETGAPGETILRQNREDLFDRHILGEGERILSMVGGLGRLARDGDPDSWRQHAGHQFGAQYYGRRTRRPQSILGIGEEGRVLYLLVQEGHPHSERCFTLPELSHVMRSFGAREVAFNDGGGSAEMVVMGRAVVRTENAAMRRPNSSVFVIREGATRVAEGTSARRRTSYR